MINAVFIFIDKIIFSKNSLHGVNKLPERLFAASLSASQVNPRQAGLKITQPVYHEEHQPVTKQISQSRNVILCLPATFAG